MDGRISGPHLTIIQRFPPGAVPLLLAAVAMWACGTIPPEPDPDSLPSHVLEPPSAAYRDAVEEGRSIARSLVAEEKLPGLSLAVAVNGEIVWAEGFRWADLENQTPVTPATLFRIGGVSKTLTAAAVRAAVRARPPRPRRTRAALRAELPRKGMAHHHAPAHGPHSSSSTQPASPSTAWAIIWRAIGLVWRSIRARSR